MLVLEGWTAIADKYMEYLYHLCIPKWMNILSVFMREDHDVWV